MGRSGPQITAKRQLLDCVTLMMVLLSLLFRPGKDRGLFQSAPLHSAPSGLFYGKSEVFSKCWVAECNLFDILEKFRWRSLNNYFCFLVINGENSRC